MPTCQIQTSVHSVRHRNQNTPFTKQHSDSLYTKKKRHKNPSAHWVLSTQQQQNSRQFITELCGYKSGSTFMNKWENIRSQTPTFVLEQKQNQQTTRAGHTPTLSLYRFINLEYTPTEWSELIFQWQNWLKGLTHTHTDRERDNLCLMTHHRLDELSNLKKATDVGDSRLPNKRWRCRISLETTALNHVCQTHGPQAKCSQPSQFVRHAGA